MTTDLLIILLGVAAAFAFYFIACARGRQIDKRAQEVREQMARDPQSIYVDLAEMLQDARPNGKKE